MFFTDFSLHHRSFSSVNAPALNYQAVPPSAASIAGQGSTPVSKTWFTHLCHSICHARLGSWTFHSFPRYFDLSFRKNYLAIDNGLEPPISQWAVFTAALGLSSTRPVLAHQLMLGPVPLSVHVNSLYIYDLSPQFRDHYASLNKMASNADFNPSQPVCQNCSTSTTPLWRRDELGSVLCNACGLFLKLHGRPRPISLKTDVIKSRNRVKNSGQALKKAAKVRVIKSWSIPVSLIVTIGFDKRWQSLQPWHSGAFQPSCLK